MDTFYLLFYCFVAIAQIYFYMFVGIVAYYRKIFTMESLKKFTSIIYYVLMPIYSFMELSKVTTMETIKTYWLLIFSTSSCILVGYLIARIFHFTIGLDERIGQSFSVALAIPAIGSFPLVVAKLMCFSGGPLEGVPSCSRATGLMIVNYLASMIFLHFFALNLVQKDKNLNDNINRKLKYLWHVVLKKFDLKDYYALLLCEQFIEDPEIRFSVYNNFVENFELIIDEKFCYKLHLKNEKLNDICLKDKNEDSKLNKLPENDISLKEKKYETKLNVLPETNTVRKEIKKDLKMIQFPENDTDLKNIKEDSKMIELPEIEKYIKTEEKDLISNNLQMNSIRKLSVLDLGINFNLKELRIDKMKSGLFTGTEKKELDDGDYFNTSNLEENVNNYVENFKKMESSKYIDNKIINDLSLSLKLNKLKSWNLKKEENVKNMEEQKSIDVEVIDQKIIVPNNEEINIVTEPLVENLSNKIDVEIYYKTLFDTIEEHLNDSQKKAFNEHKHLIFQNLRKDISVFPIIEGISLPMNRINFVEEEWKKLEDYSKKNNLELKLEGTNFTITWKLIVSKIFSPPIIGCVLGLMFGISSISTILFSPNHFISNVIQIISIYHRSIIPLLFTCTGFTLMSSKSLILNSAFNKLHLGLSFLVRGVLVPFLGLAFIYLMRKYYGGEVESDRMLRFAMYVVWSLPTSSNLIVILNLVMHFREELGYILMWQIALMFINVTLNFLIYFSTIG